MELTPTQYAEQQLRKGKTPKQVLKQLRESKYGVDDAYDIVAQARKRRALKKAAYIALLAITIPLIAYAIATPQPPAAAPGAQTTPAPSVTQQAISSQDANICDKLPLERRADCIYQTTNHMKNNTRESLI